MYIFERLNSSLRMLGASAATTLMLYLLQRLPGVVFIYWRRWWGLKSERMRAEPGA